MLLIHSKKKCFSIDAFVQCCHKVFNFIAITVPVKSTGSSVRCRLRRFFSRLLRRRKRIDNSRKLLDLDGNMLMWVLRELL